MAVCHLIRHAGLQGHDPTIRKLDFQLALDTQTESYHLGRNSLSGLDEAESALATATLGHPGRLYQLRYFSNSSQAAAVILVPTLLRDPPAT